MPEKHAGPGERIRANFGTVWPVHLTRFTRLLVQLRGRFDGDLDLMLVLAVIGDRMRPDSWTPELRTGRKLTVGDDGARRKYPVNIQSVSDFSGIPRETVRRKVSILQRNGWVTRHADGRLEVTPRAAEDLEAATGDSVAYLEALLAAFEATRGRAGGPG